MPDEPMFAKLMANPEPTHDRATGRPNGKPKVLHLSVNLPENQAQIVDRYFSLLYQTELRTTRSALIGLAVEILDRILDGAPPDKLDNSILDAYARERGGAEVRAYADAPAASDER